jgi:hypothetical protein
MNVKYVMHCVFVTIFAQEKYLDMFYILFESLTRFGKLNIPVVVYTTTEFMNKIKSVIKSNILFKINDSYNTPESAFNSKLDFFNLNTPYTKVLYLDVDCIVTENISDIFAICEEDILYVGNSDMKKTDNVFSTSILLFKNCQPIKDLFDNVRSDMYKRSVYDQPFIVHHSITNNLYQDFSTNIQHVSGEPKLTLMISIFSKLEFTLDPPKLYIGSSNENIKRIPLSSKKLIGHNLLNLQEDGWRDTFDIRVVNNEVVVRRTDTNTGWGQDIILPIKHNKILVYGSHYDKIGFILDFCKRYKIDVDLVVPENSWLDMYKTQYEFTVLNTIPSYYNHYIFVLVLSDEPLPHLMKNGVRIRKQDKFVSLSDAITFPVFRYITLHDKVSLMSDPTIACIGNPDLSFISNLHEFNIIILNKDTLLTGLSTATYMVCVDDFEFQIPLSFSCGCKLILPKHVLPLKSSIEYEGSIHLDTSPSLFETFNEREELIHSRDASIINLPHMKLLLDFKTIHWR